MTEQNQIDDANELNAPRNGYKVLFVALLALWLLAPFARQLGADRGFELVLLTLLLMAAGYATSNEVKRFRVIIVLGILVGALTWIDYFPFIDLYPQLPSLVASVVFFMFVAYVLLTDILSKQSHVDMALIYGALSVYLLIGIAFAWLYGAIYLVHPDSFSGISAQDAHSPSLIYFSFVTLTTLGYGDISPNNELVGSMATLEAFIGQVYLTVLVARLVGMQISQSPD
jgi:hypothetical protein